MYRYVVVFELVWRSKKGEVVNLPVVQEVRMSVKGNEVVVNVLPVGIVRAFRYVGKEIRQENIEELLRIVCEDVKRVIRKKLKFSLKGSVYETLRIRVVYKKGGEVNEEEAVSN